MIPLFGTQTSAPSPSEEIEMCSWFNWLRKEHPRYWAVAVHIRNEGARHARQMAKIKVQGGFVKGASDISVPGCPSFVCEMKTRNKKSAPTPEQMDYLHAAKDVGAFACVAYGALGAVEAFEHWLGLQEG